MGVLIIWSILIPQNSVDGGEAWGSRGRRRVAWSRREEVAHAAGVWFAVSWRCPWPHLWGVWQWVKESWAAAGRCSTAGTSAQQVGKRNEGYVRKAEGEADSLLWLQRHMWCEEKQELELPRVKHQELKTHFMKFFAPYKVQVYNYVVAPT